MKEALPKLITAWAGFSKQIWAPNRRLWLASLDHYNQSLMAVSIPIPLSYNLKVYNRWTQSPAAMHVVTIVVTPLASEAYGPKSILVLHESWQP